VRPLEGIRVVEVSMWGYVPSCGAVLADWGASVVKVDPPDGDPIRGLIFAGVPPTASGVSYMSERLAGALAVGDRRADTAGQAQAAEHVAERTRRHHGWELGPLGGQRGVGRAEDGR
jgi:hypothetical protein